jgi:hypothetical protein
MSTVTKADIRIILWRLHRAVHPCLEFEIAQEPNLDVFPSQGRDRALSRGCDRFTGIRHDLGHPTQRGARRRDPLGLWWRCRRVGLRRGYLVSGRLKRPRRHRRSLGFRRKHRVVLASHPARLQPSAGLSPQHLTCRLRQQPFVDVRRQRRTLGVAHRGTGKRRDQDLAVT